MSSHTNLMDQSFFFCNLRLLGVKEGKRRFSLIFASDQICNKDSASPTEPQNQI